MTKVEYKGLEELKEQDLAELKQDEDRIQLLVESSIRRVKENIKEREESVARRNGELKSLKQMAEVNRLKMNMFLVRVSFLNLAFHKISILKPTRCFGVLHHNMVYDYLPF
jgi:hypothetical protein